tara:strand:+ start:2754 stop:4115 length:1362 start_codon:yes stop_codon:yes gene_type:complete
MSKYSDFYPAAAGTAFPFTGSGGITGSLEVRGGVGFRYESRGTVAGWSSTGQNYPTSTSLLASSGNSFSALGYGGTAGGVSTTNAVLWDGISWGAADPMTTGRSELSGIGNSSNAAIAAGGRIGTSPAGTTTQVTEEYDGAQWITNSPTSNLTRSTYGLAQAGSNTSAFSAGGTTGGATTSNTFETWNGTNWTNPGATLNTPRGLYGGATGNGSLGLIAGGGTASPAATNRTEEWDGISWVQNNPTSDLPANRRVPGAGGTNSNSLLAGGDSAGGGSATDTTFQYNGVSWSNLSPTINMVNANRLLSYAGDTNNGISIGGTDSLTQEYNANTTVAGKYETFNYSEQTGATTVSNLQETSAERFKENIKDLPSQTEKIKNLQPVQYSWKHNNKQDIGFIAERFDNHYPELVKKNEKGETEGIQYSHVVSVLVKELQDQQAQIEEIQQKIDARKK